MDVDKITGSGLSQTVSFSVVNKIIRRPISLSSGSEWITLVDLGTDLQ